MANVKISQLTPKGANLAATDLLEISEFNGSGYETKSITGQEIIDAASGGGAAWGSITGTLSSQTDLNTALSGKQATLVSGTNIKTINSTSLLGSGNVAVQDTLVSGTNIKTINSTSLLGSGNVAVQPTLVSGTNIKTINGNSVLGSGNLTISGGGTNPTDTYFPVNSGGTFIDSLLYQLDFGYAKFIGGAGAQGIGIDGVFGGRVCDLNGTMGNGTIGTPAQGLFIGYDLFESAFSAGSFMMYTGTHTTISKWLKTTDENGNIYYIPLYL